MVFLLHMTGLFAAHHILGFIFIPKLIFGNSTYPSKSYSNAADTSFKHFIISICCGQCFSHCLHPIHSEAFPYS